MGADVYFYIAALAAYCLALGTMSYALVFQKDSAWKRGGYAMLAALALHTASLLLRWWVTGHIATVGNFENASICGWTITLFVVWFYYRYPQFRAAALFTLPVVILTLGVGLMTDTSHRPMSASLKTFWLYIHIMFAWFVTGAMSFATGASVLYLIKDKKERKGEMTPFYEKLPSLARIDDLIYRNVVVGFICYAVMIGSGALWSKDLWGGYWSWDPVETWSLVSWLIYGFILHSRFTFGWKGKVTAWMVILALLTVFIAMFGVNFMASSSRHLFNIDDIK